MSKKVVWNGGALLAPVPVVMVSCGDMDRSNIMTVAWTGIINTVPPRTYISVREKRYSYELIKNSGEFAINLVPAALVKKADFCGVYTGAKVDKFKRCEFTKDKSEKIKCPIIGESPLSLECKVIQVIPLGTHDMFLADIVSVDVSEELIDSNGRLMLERADLCAYVHGEYYNLGKKMGTFGFSARKKNSRKPK